MTASTKRSTKRTAKHARPDPCPAEAAPIWLDADGTPGPAPAGARASRRVQLGDGLAVVHVSGDARLGKAVGALNKDAWRIERGDGTTSMLVAYRGPGFTTGGVQVVTIGTADLSGPGVVNEPGELPKLRWPA